MAPRTICRTDRLTLRELTMDDLSAYVRMRSHPQVYRFLDGAKTPAWIRGKLFSTIANYARYGFDKWAVVLNASGEVIGRCGPSRVQVNHKFEIELGYTFSRAFWGYGFAAEAARAAMEYSFDTLHANRLISLIYPLNLRSIHVAQRIGMTSDGTVKWYGETTRIYAKSI